MTGLHLQTKISVYIWTGEHCFKTNLGVGGGLETVSELPSTDLRFFCSVFNRKFAVYQAQAYIVLFLKGLSTEI